MAFYITASTYNIDCGVEMGGLDITDDILETLGEMKILKTEKENPNIILGRRIC